MLHIVCNTTASFSIYLINVIVLQYMQQDVTSSPESLTFKQNSLVFVLITQSSLALHRKISRQKEGLHCQSGKKMKG